MKRKKQELFPRPGRVLELRNVVKRYGDATVLGGIDLRVDEGQVVTLIGASGSGKSTLLRCVNLLEAVDDGQILLEGTDIADPRAEARARPAADGDRVPGVQPVPAHDGAGERRAGAACRARACARRRRPSARTSCCDRVGLDAFAGAYPDRLSGGQQQRVAIARALAVQPRLLLLDEITSALDPELVGEVLAIVRELARGSSTILMATHEMGFARQVSDHVVFLDGGRVREAGPPEQVLRYPVEERTQQFLARVIAAGRLS